MGLFPMYALVKHTHASHHTLTHTYTRKERERETETESVWGAHLKLGEAIVELETW